ncbi:MAG: hypothetical protein K2L11_08845 [Muribaculaceae bacterium]|nr:hypothetical protein [Muribaculaceae bacterium]
MASRWGAISERDRQSAGSHSARDSTADWIRVSERSDAQPRICVWQASESYRNIKDPRKSGHIGEAGGAKRFAISVALDSFYILDEKGGAGNADRLRALPCRGR